jgi:hypothetical protein
MECVVPFHSLDRRPLHSHNEKIKLIRLSILVDIETTEFFPAGIRRVNCRGKSGAAADNPEGNASERTSLASPCRAYPHVSLGLALVSRLIRPE